ncbi:spore germination protein [Pullulanibacillus pueri]|uniref:Spore germination protein YaaH n=1 Tax=Pullulanibacillus pueri TaxID=1437324 RepID=A0A8J2ZUL9_9BACL|nr:LysM peptidoglycan-binding domain-containing protein [Pullulanibacillus pueri]MBM7681430.1 spore germination protein [Pullulanibacillus pueri]GGH78846.1 spore germination protein YaaH [Pullulanibacillus pueri]
MQIHVVSQGDTIYALARTFGVPAQEIITQNNLDHPNDLVVGETLLIPTTNTYIIQPGDTLWEIAKKLNINYQALLDANPNVRPQNLYPGQSLSLPQREKQHIIVNGYLEPHTGNAQRFVEASAALTYLSVFSYEVSAEGNLTAPDDAEVLAAVKNTDVSPLMVITNLSEGEFKREIAAAIFNSNDVQEHLISNILSVLRQKGYRGINIDFEFLGSNMREQYNQFLQKITQRMHQEGYIVSTALAPKTSGTQVGAWYEAHDYAFHGRTVDFVVLMTYEWGWSGGPPMPVSPITQVRQVVNYALSVMPANKIVMSIPLYGYDWTLPYQEGGKFARAVRYQQAIDLARQNHTNIEYNQKEESPFFRYTDAQGQQHIVYFEDLRTMEAMFQMVDDDNLRGISFWNLAFTFPQVWPLLQDKFTIIKEG